MINGRAFSSKKEYRDVIVPAVQSIFPLFLFLANESFQKPAAEDLIRKFNEVFSVDVDHEIVVVDYSEKEEYELKDEINYLRVCVKNISGFDLDEEDLSSLKKEEEKTTKYTKRIDSVSIFRNILNEDFETDRNSKVNKLFDDLLLKTHAYDRLSQDIRDGSVYIYKSKPKRNVFIKYLLTFLLSLGIFSSLLFCVVSFISLIKGSSNGSQWAPFALSILMIVFFTVGIYKIKDSFSNDNFKYSFQKNSCGYVSVFSILWLTIATTYGLDNLDLSQTPGMEKICFSASLFIVVLVLIIYLISYFFLQPKKDKKLIDSILDKHMSDLSKDVSFK